MSDLMLEALILNICGNTELLQEKLDKDVEEIREMMSRLRTKEPDAAMLKLKEENMRILKEQGCKFVTEEEARRLCDPFEGLFY